MFLCQFVIKKSKNVLKTNEKEVKKRNGIFISKFEWIDNDANVYCDMFRMWNETKNRFHFDKKPPLNLFFSHQMEIIFAALQIGNVSFNFLHAFFFIISFSFAGERHWPSNFGSSPQFVYLLFHCICAGTRIHTHKHFFIVQKMIQKKKLALFVHSCYQLLNSS